MPLENLLKLVETLRDRIDEHGPSLRLSEALTRYALIDPLLRELGWDTADPALVIPEYRSGVGSSDYALLVKGKPVMMVEAKKLSTPLRDAVLSQGINYCLMEGTEHFTVTDGQCWEVYETHRPVPIDEKRIVSFDLKGQSPAAECLKALALWRPSVVSGHVATGSAPVPRMTESGVSSSLVESAPHERGEQARPSADSQPVHNVSQSTRHSNDQSWQPVSQIAPQVKTRPTELMFPDGTCVIINSWKAMLVEVSRWLIDANHLTTSHCPIPYSDRSTRYVVALRPFHDDGSEFDEPSRVNIGPFFIDTKHSAPQIVRPTRSLIERVGQDPAQFKVRFS